MTILEPTGGSIPFFMDEMSCLKWMHEHYDEKVEIWLGLPHCDTCNSTLTCPDQEDWKYCFGCKGVVRKTTMTKTLLRRIDPCRKKERSGPVVTAPPNPVRRASSPTLTTGLFSPIKPKF